MKKGRLQEKINEILKRLIDGERIRIGGWEIYYDYDILMSNNVGPFMAINKETNKGPCRAPATVLEWAAMRELPWYKECDYPVLAFVSDTIEEPDINDDLVLLKGVETTSDKDILFMDYYQNGWLYATPVPVEQGAEWLYDSGKLK